MALHAPCIHCCLFVSLYRAQRAAVEVRQGWGNVDVLTTQVPHAGFALCAMVSLEASYNLLMDDITISRIPKPATITLLGIGLLKFGRGRQTES